MNIDQIREAIAEGNYNLRSAKVTEQYYKYHAKILQEWASIADVIKSNYLGATIKYNTLNLKYATDCSIKYALTLNDFPYNVNENVKHMVLWSVEPLTNDQINEILTFDLGPVTDLYWFEQETRYKSVKDLWHIHVFYEC